MKKCLALGLAFAMVIALASCGSDTQSSLSQSGGEGKLKIAVLIPDTINDGSWGTNGYTAAKAVAETYEAEFSYVEIKSPAEVITALTDYAEREYDIIFAHGSQYDTNCKEIGTKYPDTYFVVSGGSTFTENVTSVDFRLMEGAYLAGVLAASMTKTGKVATVGSQELPVIMDNLNGFKDGVMATNPDVECIISFTGSATDVAKARETVMALSSNGVDIMDIHLDQASQGAYAAGEEIADSVKMIAGNGQMAADFPTLIVADVYSSYTNAFLTVAEDIVNNEFKQGEGAYSVGVPEGAVMVELNPDLDIPANAKSAFEKAYQGIRDGTIVVERHSNATKAE